MLSTVHNADTLGKTHTFLPLKMEGLTPEMVRKAEEELNETPEKKQEALKELKRLIDEEVDFEPCMDENYLLRFLRARKFDPKGAIATLKNFYTYKIHYSGKITDRLPSSIRKLLALNASSASLQRDRDGSVIQIVKTSCIDLNEVSFNDVVAILLMTMDILLQSEATQICGVVFIIDLAGMCLRKTRQMASPTAAYRMLKATQDCIPVRIKAIHVVNEPFYYTILVNIFKPFMSQKIKNRLYFHGKYLEDLYEKIPQEILPSELGGYQGPLDFTFADEIMQADDHFSNFFKYGFQGKRAENLRGWSLF